VRRVLPAALLGIGLLLAACGVPTSPSPEIVPRHDVPFHLLSPTVPTSTTTTQPAVAYVAEHIELLNASGKLLAVSREVPVPASLAALLAALLAGPTAAEASSGITTALPPQVKIISTSETGGVATLNLNSAFGQINGSAETQAVAQLVLTASTEPTVSSVLFEIEGSPISVPTAGGVVSAAPVVPLQYLTMVAPQPEGSPGP